MPSAAATSPSRIGPDRSTVASADSWVGVSPASSWCRSRRDSRAMATRSRVASIEGAAGDGSVAVTRISCAIWPEYAKRAVWTRTYPWSQHCQQQLRGRPAQLWSSQVLNQRTRSAKEGGSTVAMAPSISYSMTVRLEVGSRGRAGSEITPAGEDARGIVTAPRGEAAALDVNAAGPERLRVDVTCAARDTAHAEAIVDALSVLPDVSVHKVSDRTFLLHLGGKIEMGSKVPLRTRDELSMAYTPGVARVSMAIAQNPDDVRRLTIKRNSVAVVTDGSAVLGLGNIGPYAALPVMEGKAALFKRFAGIDAWPICLDTQDTDEIVRTVQAIAPGWGGINREDISAPRCFEVERRLRELLDIPVFHDDQHGTAIVVMAA